MSKHGTRSSQEGCRCDGDQDGRLCYAECVMKALREVFAYANERARQPVDFNYIAVLRDDWDSLREMIFRA